jgi:valyl-tRNA synthetase
MDWLVRLISEIRAVRSEMNVPAAARTALLVRDANADTGARLERQAGLIERLARVEKIGTADEAPKGSVQIVLAEATYFLPLGGVIDVEQETARLEREIAKFDGEIVKVEKKLGNEKFISRAPFEVVEENRERLADFNQSRDKLKDALERLAAL